MKLFKNMGIFSKIFTIVGATIVIMVLVLSLYMLPELDDTMKTLKENSVRDVVHVAYSIAEGYYEKASQGELTEQEAKEKALEAIKILRYNGGHYFWVCDSKLQMLVNSGNPDLEGKFVSNVTDAEGNPLFTKFVSSAKEKGETSVNFTEKSSDGKPVSKIAYVVYFPKWDWIIGSQKSMSDVETFMKTQNLRIAGSFFVMFILIIIISYFIAKNIVNEIKTVTDAAKKIERGNYSIEIELDTKDEIGILAKTINKLTENISLFMSYLEHIPAPIMVIDKEFNVIYMNEPGKALVGKTEEEYKREKCYNLMHAEHCNTDECRLKRAMQSGKAEHGEQKAYPQKVEYDILYTGIPTYDKKGNIDGAMEFIADITNIKKRETFLKRHVEQLLEKLQELAKGNLAVNVKEEYEDELITPLFLAFNTTISNLRQMIAQVMDAVQATASASTEISSSAEEMSAGAQEQASQVMEVAGAIEEMSRTIIDTTEHTNRAAEMSKAAGDVAAEGGTAVQNMINGMEKIASVVKEAAEIVQQLGENSGKIGEIIKVINDIADQTNLLALNAAIEAARAGEQGRGFAVVADEVRKLAERTTVATKEIAEMIKEIQNGTENVVISIRNGVDEVENGKKIAEEAGESMNKIVSVTEQVGDLITQIATASEEQAATSEEISKSIDAINNVIGESTQGVQQIAAAAEDLNRLTEHLQSVVDNFQLQDERTPRLLN